MQNLENKNTFFTRLATFINLVFFILFSIVAFFSWLFFMFFIGLLQLFLMIWR